MRSMNRTLPTALAAVLMLGVALAGHGAGAAKDKNKDLEATPQVKAYAALRKALAAGDYEAYKKCLTSAGAREIDRQAKEMNKTPKEIMGFLKELSPTDVKFTDLKVDGKKAVLSATGKMDGSPTKVAIDLEEEDGQWKVGKQHFSS
ncbi:MAG: nuclear transport factor 2 family protein [Acidobacteriota bacterium]|nr:nuclear transport factor 2 family protein [Acidobacteriota bacterium]